MNEFENVFENGKLILKAPIKNEYCVRNNSIRNNDNELLDIDVPNLVEEPQNSKIIESTSKKQRKKRLKEVRDKKLCIKFIKNKCENGNKCRFSHDVQTFLNEKLHDLPGLCPFYYTYDICPYGLNCRWASTHNYEVDLLAKTHRNILNQLRYQILTISDSVELPCSEKIKVYKNVLDKDMQFKLWKGRYDFNRADAILNKYNIKIKRKETYDISSDAEINMAIPTDQINILSDNSCLIKVNDINQKNSKIDFKNKLYLAPLTTLGNLPFRRVCVNYGADVTCSEMALATNLLQGQTSEWALLKRHPCEKIFGIQIAGGYADSIARCCQVIDECCNYDFIDLNAGCPIDIICDKAAGSSLLKKENKLKQIITTASEIMIKPLTVKMRKGYYDNINIAHELIPKLKLWGAMGVTVHGRSREQRYLKHADWQYIYECANISYNSELEFIGNGDIFSYDEWSERMRRNDKISTCMIGRGALIKPWIFTEIKEKRTWDISANERFEILKQFCSYGLEHWGSDNQGVENTRKFLLEWLSFLCRYIPVGLLEIIPQHLHWWPPAYVGRNDLETLLSSDKVEDWLRISEMLLGKIPNNYVFTPKHGAKAYVLNDTSKN